MFIFLFLNSREDICTITSVFFAGQASEKQRLHLASVYLMLSRRDILRLLLVIPPRS